MSPVMIGWYEVDVTVPGGDQSGSERASGDIGGWDRERPGDHGDPVGWPLALLYVYAQTIK